MSYWTMKGGYGSFDLDGNPNIWTNDIVKNVLKLSQ